MNTIIKNRKNYCAISNTTNAEPHKHWFFQLFLSDKLFEITVHDTLYVTSMILVGMDVIHEFKATGIDHVTLLVDPSSHLGRAFHGLLESKRYYIFTESQSEIYRSGIKELFQNPNHKVLIDYVERLCVSLENDTKANYDTRITEIVNTLDACDDNDMDHAITTLSNKVSLSQSRLSHLFKEEIGLPLKSYLTLHKIQKVYAQLFDGVSITTAAVTSSFDSPSHFASTNKRMTGMSATDILKDSVFLKVE